PDGDPLRINKKNWIRHANSAAHTSSRSQSSSKRWQAIQCTPHDDTVEQLDAHLDPQHAYNDSTPNEPTNTALSSHPVPYPNEETTLAEISEFRLPPGDITSPQDNNDNMAAIVENMVSFQVAGTDKPNLIGNELDDPYKFP
ncbi:hypothetical protein FRC11_001183, partial [Ceratobasidium sp. 423]